MNTQLRKNPLVYVLAQIKINPILKLGQYIPDIQEVMRKQFPNYKEMILRAMQPQQRAQRSELVTLTQWHFTDKESYAGIVMNTNAILFHSTQYHSFDAFLKQLQTILEEINKLLDISIYTRTALRYINFISSPVEKMLATELQGFYIKKDDTFENIYVARTETVQKTKIGVMKIQATHTAHKKKIDDMQNEREIFLPLDLRQVATYLTFKLHHSKVQKNNYLLFDIDHFSEGQNDFNIKNITKTLQALHNGAHDAFFKAVTKEAVKASL